MRYLYMRASTNEQKQSLQRQEKFGRDNDILESNWFREYASGAKSDRIELQRLLHMVHENDEIWCIDPSRLTRSLKYMLELLDFAKEKKIKLVMGGFVLDCTGEISIFTEGQLMMLALVNELQRLIIVNAVREGLAASKEKGVILGRPKTNLNTIPDQFYKYYPLYSSKQITKVEFSKISGLSRSSIYKYLSIINK